MKHLIFDTETTGLVDFNAAFDAPTQPRLVQLAAVVMDDSDWQPRALLSVLITDVEVPLAAYNVHHISSDLCRQFGFKPSYALHIFETMWNLSDERWAFNADYDVAILSGELLRINRKEFAEKLPTTRCLMRPHTDICKIPGKFGKYKWPKLSEVYAYYFNEPPVKEHDALADVQSTARILRAYKQTSTKTNI